MSVHSYAAERTDPPSLWRKLTARESMARRLDWTLLVAALALTVLGTLLVYSATRGRTELTGGDPTFFLVRHLINIVLSLLLAAFVVWAGVSRLRDATPLLYALSVALSLLVLSPAGTSVNGSQSWLQLGGGFAFQPSELVKIAVILAMAALFAARAESQDQEIPDSRTVLSGLALVGVPSVLVLLTPDLGQVLCLAVIALGVLTASAAPRGWVLGLLGSAGVGAVLVWQAGLLDEYQINRLAAFANPDLDPAGVGYNTNQARIAIGSGGLSGAGLFQGHQTTGQFVPEQHTDFIFTVAGEELGFLGAGLIILLLGVVLWRALRIAQQASDLYGSMVAAGIAAWLAFQSFENMGMSLGIMPVTGLPLPFISYGGSSMFAVWIGVGLLLAIRLRSRSRG